MLQLRSFRTKRILHIYRTLRTMSLVNVKCTEGEDRLQISFAYAHQGGIERTFNAERLKTEKLDVTLTRLSENILKKVSKKKKKRKIGEEAEPEQIKVSVLASNGKTVVNGDTNLAEALLQGNIITINDMTYTVNVNPPKCFKAQLSDSIMVGFPQYPNLDLEFADLEDCEYLWFKVKHFNESGEANAQTKSESDIVIERHELSRELSYTPTTADIGYKLCFTVIPKYGSRQGDPLTIQSKYDVTAGPGFCPFENRQQYTQKVTDVGEFRVISYNILADVYASQDYSREVLFNYCPPYALELDYRKHLLLGELKGYNGDIVCLQEVDKKFFEGGLLFAMETQGLDGAFLQKGGIVEGSAIFFRKSKFRLVEEQRHLIKDILETHAGCQQLIKKTYCVPALKEKLETRTSVLHVLVLEPMERPGQLVIVANTHLYFHPDAGHIRLIQMLTAMTYIEALRTKYKKQKPTMVFCGDFNSTPYRGIYEYMTTKQIKEDNIDWKDGGEEQFAAEMNFSHTRNYASGCGLPAYTNYTPAFNGHLDYIYYDVDALEVVQVIPPPDHRDVELHSGIPSIAFPSDHIAQICDFKWK